MAQVKKQGYWLSDLPSTSHPYRCGWTPDLSGKEDYSRKMVGDDFDTSPYPCTDGQQCISVAAYIKKYDGAYCSFGRKCEVTGRQIERGCCMLPESIPFGYFSLLTEKICLNVLYVEILVK